MAKRTDVPKYIIDYIGFNYEGKWCKDIATEIKKEFGYDIKATTVKGIMYRNGWKSSKKGNSKAIPKEIKDRILEVCEGKYRKEIAQLIKDEFNYDITTTAIGNILKRNGVKSGMTTKFVKGHTINKGKKYKKRECSSYFKKGHKPHNYRPIGSEINHCGIVYIKTEKNKWRSKAIVMYEKYHDVKLKKNQGIVTFKNGDKTDFSKENLLYLTRREAITVFESKVLQAGNIELTDAYVSILKVRRKIRKLENE